MKETTTARSSGQKVIDPNFFNLVSQIAHFFTTYGLVLTVGKFLGWKGIIIAGVLCAIYAGAHEFWYDPKHESPLTRGSDVEDFAFLVAGVVAAVIVYWI
jgi:hypothetical protein